VRVPVEEVTLTARFKVDLVDVDEAVISEIHRLFAEYREIVNELLELTISNHITSFTKLYYTKYHELRKRHLMLPSQYIVTACRHAASIYKPFIERKKLGICKREKPAFKGRTLWLNKQLFKLDVESWKVSIAIREIRWFTLKWITLKLLHGKYHNKFKGMKPSEAHWC
jgi:putative transposase